MDTVETISQLLPLAPPRSVLVVDDDYEIRETLEMMLDEQGYPVRTAANGLDALRLLDKGEPPGVILLDLTMPVMDGGTLLAVLDENPRYSSIPVVIITAVPENATRVGAPVIAKPMDFDRVLDVVRAHCGDATAAWDVT